MAALSRGGVHPTAIVEEGAALGEGTRVWHFSHVMSGAVIGARCTLGQNVFVASRVTVGDGCKIQNNVSLYDGVVLEDDVFLGPSCVFTNVKNPRAAIPRRDAFVTTRVRRGATVGANATLVCGAIVGRHALVGAGAVVVATEVPDYALVLGVPARRVGWVSRHGHRLAAASGDAPLVCPESGWRYREEAPGVLRCLDRGEDEPL